MTLRRQYQVIEKSQDGRTWYPHPSTIYDSQEEALERLWDLRRDYEQYGRHFTIRERQISSWKLIPLQQLPIGPPMTKR